MFIAIEGASDTSGRSNFTFKIILHCIVWLFDMLVVNHVRLHNIESLFVSTTARGHGDPVTNY